MNERWEGRDVNIISLCFLIVSSTNCHHSSNWTLSKCSHRRWSSLNLCIHHRLPLRSHWYIYMVWWLLASALRDDMQQILLQPSQRIWANLGYDCLGQSTEALFCQWCTSISDSSRIEAPCVTKLFLNGRFDYAPFSCDRIQKGKINCNLSHRSIPLYFLRHGIAWSQLRISAAPAC